MKEQKAMSIDEKIDKIILLSDKRDGVIIQCREETKQVILEALQDLHSEEFKDDNWIRCDDVDELLSGVKE